MNKKHTHFLKEAFLLTFFLNPPLQNSWRHFLSSFCVCIRKSFLLFYNVFFVQESIIFKTGITGFGECYRYVFLFVTFLILKIRLSWIVKIEFRLCVLTCFLSILRFFRFFFFTKTITDIKISLTPQIGSHGHKKTPDCYTKGHSKVKNHVIYFFFFFFWLKHLL